MNENWSTITSDDVLGEFTPVETATLNGIQAATDNLGNLIGRVVNQVRKAYRDGGREVAFTSDTIPDSERSRVIAIARWKWLISFPKLTSMQTDERRKAWEEADNYFNAIAKREIKGEGGAQPFNAAPRQATRGKLSGLI